MSATVKEKRVDTAVGKVGPDRTYERFNVSLGPSTAAAPSVDELASLLDDAISCEDNLTWIAKRSYRHQLGFEKFVLRGFDDGGCLRLHYWDRVSEDLEDIHSHCASFSSRLIVGHFTQVFFAAIPGQSYDVYSYRFNPRTGESEAELRSMTDVRMQQTQTFVRGDRYDVDAQQLHRVVDVAVGTLTVSSWRPRSTDAIVLKKAAVQKPPACASAGLQPAYLRARLEYLRDKVSAA